MDNPVSALMEDNVSDLSDENLVLIRISIPDLGIQKCMQFHQEELIWDVKQQVLNMITKDLKESFNYGLYCPPLNGRAGKFLDDERHVVDYPFPGPIGNLELKYKRRVYKMINMDAKQIRQLHTKANFRRILEYVNNGQAEKISKLCSKGMDPNFHCPENGETPLTLAVAQKSCKKIILALANGGAHLDFRTRDGVTALHRAVEKNNMEALKTLLDLGASPNYKDSKGTTPLYYSVLYPTDAHVCELLLHDHASIGASDQKQWQETHQACRNGLVQHLEHLLFYGADINARNASGNTPLHVCAANEQEGCARVLLFRGAHQEALNYANQTPYQVAIIAGNPELADIIKNFQAEDVVHFREAPTYNPRRRTSSLLNRTRSDPRLEITLGLKPPSPSPSNRSLPPFSCASSLSETSTGSSTCTQHSNDDSSGDTASLSAVTEHSIASDSSGICVSYNTNMDKSLPLQITLAPGLACVCVENYLPMEDGHLHLAQGDIVEITGSTDDGYLEGICHGQQGLFPASCVQEVWLRKRVEGRRTQSSPGKVLPFVTEQKRHLKDGRTAVLQKGKKGFGFVLRGAKSTSPLMEIQPSEKFPSLQYLDDVDAGGPADLAGLRKGDFLIAINGEDVSHVSHEYVVNLIRKSGNTVTMTVISCPHFVDSTPPPVQTLKSPRHFSTLPRKLNGGSKPVPIPPRRDPSTTLSVGRSRARSMVAGLAEIEALDRGGVEQTIPRGLPPKSASVQSKLVNGSRTTAAEIEQMFLHQKELRDTIKSPKVYASVAEMKRSRTPKGTKLERLHKVFRSTPDLINDFDNLQTESNNNRSEEENATVLRLNGMNLHRSNNNLVADGHWRSIDDIYNNGEERRTRSCCVTPPAPTHPPPPPPPLSTVVKVDVFNSLGDYAKVINVAGGDGVKNSGVMSSFRPGDSAKLYASPVELGIVVDSVASSSLPTYKPVSIVQSRTLQPPPPNSLSSNNSSESETSGDSTGYCGSNFLKTNCGLSAPDTISTDSGNSSERGFTNPNPYAQSVVTLICNNSNHPKTLVLADKTGERKVPYIPEPDYDVSEEEDVVIVNNPPPPPPPMPPPLLSGTNCEVPPLMEEQKQVLQPKKASTSLVMGIDTTKTDLMSDLKLLIAKKAAERQKKVSVLDVLMEKPAVEEEQQVPSCSTAKENKLLLVKSKKDSNVQILQVKMEKDFPAQELELEQQQAGVSGMEEKIEESMKLIEMHANSLQEVNQLVGISVQTQIPAPVLPTKIDGVETIAPPPEFSDDSGVPPPTLTSPEKSSSKLPVRAKASSVAFSNGRMTAIRGSKSGGVNRAPSAVRLRTNSTGTLKSIDVGVNKVKVNVATISHVSSSLAVKEFQNKAVAQWSVGDVGEWLESLYLGEYKARFEAIRVDGARLCGLGSGGLTDLGVKRIGHRMNIERSLKKHLMMKQ